MSKIVTPITVQVITFNTTVPVKEVVARLEAELDKAGSADTIQKILNSKSHEEWLSIVNNKAEGQDFQYFSEFPTSKILKYVDPEGTDKAGLVIYYFGNPSVANFIMKYNPLAAYSIPPRLLIVERPEGTTVTYHLPSSVMAAPGQENDPTLVTGLASLDARLEKLAKKITAVR
ncbi:hypothetical protein CPB84DRAFT_1961022 [Gymnopilus junonius]|uniref:DUF302 domain-containing protein n=1 Tax=Gymnopilus junonius TaxID=109634 RepID=A0A9P5NRF8_GYMJU|nr:hypothetical protein CPB84DRAFT_1961022 [Gymnopilus junonius]